MSPQAAGQLPWPEILKHHLLAIEGHRGVIDMIRKHTSEGTSDHTTITTCLDRTDRMLQDAKEIAQKLAMSGAPTETNGFNSATESGYIDLSSAQDFTNAMGQHGFQDSGKGKKSKKKTANTERPIKKPKASKAAKATQALGSDDAAVATNGDNPASFTTTEFKQVPHIDDNPYFMVDSNPTPINSSPLKQDKRGTDEGDGRPSKRSKLSEQTVLPMAEGDVVEREDITAEVDARMAGRIRRRNERKIRKEAKKEAKKSKKRKRESHGGSTESPEAKKARKAKYEPKGRKKAKKGGKVNGEAVKDK